jgi:hypothetical protein
VRIRFYEKLVVSILANDFGVGLKLYTPGSVTDGTSLELPHNRYRFAVLLSR